MRVTSNFGFLEQELMDVLRLFFVPSEEIAVQHSALVEPDLIDCELTILRNGETFRFEERFSVHTVDLSDLEWKRRMKRCANVSLYDALSRLTGVSFPYGALIGIRPAKLLRQIEENPEFDADRYFLDFLKVQPEKLEALKRINRRQAPYLK